MQVSVTPVNNFFVNPTAPRLPLLALNSPHQLPGTSQQPPLTLQLPLPRTLQLFEPTPPCHSPLAIPPELPLPEEGDGHGLGEALGGTEAQLGPGGRGLSVVSCWRLHWLPYLSGLQQSFHTGLGHGPAGVWPERFRGLWLITQAQQGQGVPAWHCDLTNTAHTWFLEVLDLRLTLQITG